MLHNLTDTNVITSTAPSRRRKEMKKEKEVGENEQMNSMAQIKTLQSLNNSIAVKPENLAGL